MCNAIYIKITLKFEKQMSEGIWQDTRYVTEATQRSPMVGRVEGA